MENKRFCKQCGAELGDEAKFCAACGAKVGGEPEPSGKAEQHGEAQEIKMDHESSPSQSEKDETIDNLDKIKEKSAKATVATQEKLERLLK